MYTWGYIKESTLAKLDLDEKEAIEQNLINRFPYYANEAMTQICSAIKPKYTYYTFTVYSSAVEAKKLIGKKYGVDIDLIPVNYNRKDIRDAEYSAIKEYNEVLSKELFVGRLIKMPDDFISFNDAVDIVSYTDIYGRTYNNAEAYDTDFTVKGYNYIECRHTGTFSISYNARWLQFTQSMPNTLELDAPIDILDCIPSYIASQCYKIDDEVTAARFRNEYEMALARIDVANYTNTATLKIGGGW